MKQKFSVSVFIVLFILNTNIFGQKQRGYENKDENSVSNEAKGNTTKPLNQRDLEIKLRAERLKREEREKKEKAQRRKTRDKYEKKAEKQIDRKEKDQIKAQREIREARNSANLSGCNPSDVFISPLSQKYSKYRESITIRIVNNTKNPVDIESSRGRDGVLIKNLCPNGSVTISFVYGMYLNPYQSENFELIAIGQGTRNIFSVYLNNYGNHYSKIWSIY